MSDTGDSALVEALFKVGAHFGFSRSRRHATMKPLVYGSKNRTDILDLTKTAPIFETALTFLKGLGAHGKTVLFVGGKAEMKDLVKSSAAELKMPYVAGRWLGGTLTNFTEIKRRVKRMQELTGEREAGALAKKYTKKERVLIDREIARLEEKFFGISAMEKLPDALVVVDTRAEAIPVAEAHALGIPVVGIMNSDCDYTLVSYPVVGNDASQEAVKFFLDKIVEAYREGAKGNVAEPQS
ncbi:30S ribosomal protein S2 [Candidatus Kaiserbacteria bacterium]|nr:30S ribosomal protein S2 [Candidatus Kaiserbacteria bacterium]